MATTPSPRQQPPEPAARSGKQTPVHHAPATPQTPPTALDSRVATAEPTLSASVSASASISRDVEYLYNPPPDYPPRARRMGMEGEVLIRTRVLRNGRCDELELVQSSGYALLDQAAMEAIRKWRFRPALRGDEQVSSRIEIPVRFRLDH
jgi:protein TonB